MVKGSVFSIVRFYRTCSVSNLSTFILLLHIRVEYWLAP